LSSKKLFGHSFSCLDRLELSRSREQPVTCIEFKPAIAKRFSVVCIGLFLILSSGLTRAQIAIPATPALPAQGPLRTLEQDLSGIFNDPNFSNANWGAQVQSLETGEVLYRLNDGKSFLPASSFKAVTAAEALAFLGPDFHYTTQLVTTGRQTENVLRGDLIIRGAGDPTLGSQEISPDSSPTAVFEAWADSLRKRGITKVEGSIVADDSYFTPERYPDGWAIEDEPYYYAMQVSGLNFAENSVSVSVMPGRKSGSSVEYELVPEVEFLTVENSGVTKPDSIIGKNSVGKDTVLEPGSSSIVISRKQGQNTITVSGEIPRSGAAAHEQLSVDDPSLYAATALFATLEEKGIRVTGPVKSARELLHPVPYLKARVLASYTSPSLSEIVSVMNKRSDNLFAEALFRTVAKEMTGEGSWKRGAQIMKRFLHAVSDTVGVAIYDGSGLSRMDLMTPAVMTGLLKHMYGRRLLWPEYYKSFAIMGVDGTLSNRLKGTHAEGNVHAKTGFVTEVRSLVGYLTDRDGEMLAFSIFVNNHTAPVQLANNLQDLAILRLVNFSRKQ
jgi:D-alanyl-D-alanine carboxypeptidase/D-alanyl-D-alanine-endopeptidase (penicillin-binding protein 4)